jgi:cytochrome c-type biogenesis protein CcmF
MLIGRACLILALLTAVWGVVTVVVGMRRNDERLLASARRCVYVVAGLAALSFAIVELAYLRNDFSYAVVAGNSSSTTPLYYKATAMWSSQPGSLLLWLLILSAQSAIAIRIAARRYQALAPVASAVLLVVCAFFALLLIGWASPFEASSPTPADGAGLQPLLRYPLMAAHPVALYMGYAGFSVPFAFAVAALIGGRVDASWLVATRRFTLAAWAFLALGLVLGARWSYAELGWGGYWGWDAVENAALLPWLTGTALLHSSIIQEKRGMLKVWNVSLVALSFLLALIGTFLVRSGILDSIHAFGASTLGVPFLVAIATTMLVSVALILYRRDALASEHRLDSLLSREAIFLLNNLVLVALAFVIFWGTFFPLISEAITGDQRAVGPPWFERYTVPLGIVLVILTAIGPMFAWRKTAGVALARAFALPLVAAAVAVVAVLLWVGGSARHVTAMIAFGVIAFTVCGLAGEFVKATRARRASTGDGTLAALSGVISRNRRRYGGYIVHAGFAILLLGVAASSSFVTTVDQRVRPGDSFDVAGYRVTYQRATTNIQPEKLSLTAVLDITKDGRHVTTLRAGRELYPSAGTASGGIVARYFSGEQTSEIGLDPGATKDLWMAMQPDLSDLQPAVREADRRFATLPARAQAMLIAAILRRWQTHAEPVTIRATVRPGMTWLWMGAIIVGLGTLVAAWPRRRPLPATSQATERVPTVGQVA